MAKTKIICKKCGKELGKWDWKHSNIMGGWVCKDSKSCNQRMREINLLNQKE